MPTWSELSKEQQCVLLAAAESALLIDLLALWEPSLDWTERLPHIPRLAKAVVELADMALIEVVQSADVGSESRLVTRDRLPELVFDPRSWWTEEGPTSLVELVCTDAAAAVLETSSDVFGFRDH